MTAPEAHISIHPGYQFGAPCIAGTRVPTSSLAECVAAGDAVDEVAADYNLTRGEVLLACWYEWDRLSRFARSSLRKSDRVLLEAWDGWAADAFPVLAGYEHIAWDEVADPPGIVSGGTSL